MCLVALALGASARFPFVVAANRDEYFDRPAAPLGWWSPGADAPAVLGGRDLRGGGTWLGLTAAGRLALLTNVREPPRHADAAPSRGELVTRWLRGDATPDAYAASLAGGGHHGYNLVAADLRQGSVFHLSNRGAPHSALGNGVHGLSNAGLDTPWPKVNALKARLAAALQAHDELAGLEAALFGALADRAEASADALPATGVPLDWELALSSPFVHAPARGYGTRCSTLVVAERGTQGLRTHVVERSFDAGAPAGERRVVLDDWPPQGEAQSARVMSTCAMPASS